MFKSVYSKQVFNKKREKSAAQEQRRQSQSISQQVVRFCRQLGGAAFDQRDSVVMRRIASGIRWRRVESWVERRCLFGCIHGENPESLDPDAERLSKHHIALSLGGHRRGFSCQAVSSGMRFVVVGIGAVMKPGFWTRGPQ